MEGALGSSLNWGRRCHNSSVKNGMNGDNNRNP